MAIFDHRQLDGIRSKGFGLLDRLGSSRLQKLNDVMGRPLAPFEELAERRAFEAGQSSPAHADNAENASTGSESATTAAPVLVFYMDKQRRDVAPIVQILQDQRIAHSVLNIEGDLAAQAATRRDSKGFRLPVVFIAGEAIGGKIELINAIATGDLKRRVYRA
jgi:glutaredoxin-related protein